jgi:D-alanine-D-alanine ligase
MRVVVLYNAVSENASPSERDVLVQRDAVIEALDRLGHEPLAVPCTLNFEAAAAGIRDSYGDVVFNLVESMAGSDWLSFMVTGLLDSLRLPYTGSPTEAMFLTAHKLLAKERLCQAGLPTPAWIAADEAEPPVAPGAPTETVHRPPPAAWIIKSVSEHASLGLDESSVVGGDPAVVERRLREQVEQWGGAWFAEEYIDGREFNLAVLAGPQGPETLPPAEIDFSTFPAGKRRVVGYRAKWAEDSFEYGNTPRRFDFPPSDGPLLEQLQHLSRQCWRLFKLGGYVRVDFRVDAQSRPWILEINTNPCLSPDAGFAAAVERGSLGFDRVVQRILDDARARGPSPGARDP